MGVGEIFLRGRGVLSPIKCATEKFGGMGRIRGEGGGGGSERNARVGQELWRNESEKTAI